MPTAQDIAQQNAQLNAYARAAIKRFAVPRTQQVYTGTVVPANTPNLIINPQNIGLVRGFWVKVVHTVHNPSAVQLDLTDFGAANSLSQVQFNDLQNLTRIQCSGRYLHLVNTAKARRVFGAAYVRGTGIQTPIDYGANWNAQISAPQTIAANTDGTVTMWYWVPLAYGQDDLRGVIFANVVNLTMSLTLSFPGTYGGTVATAFGTDTLKSMYVGDIAGDVSGVTLSSSTVTVYQVYMDQLYVDPKLGLLLPVTDLATIYEIKETTVNKMVANTEFGFQYPNFRDFISTMPIYVNDGIVRGVGADINYWALQSANASYIWKKEPGLVALENRLSMGADFPPGTYYFNSRERSINTTQYGNMQLLLNPITAGANAYMVVGTEDFALQTQLSMAGSFQSA